MKATYLKFWLLSMLESLKYVAAQRWQLLPIIIVWENCKYIPKAPYYVLSFWNSPQLLNFIKYCHLYTNLTKFRLLLATVIIVCYKGIVWESCIYYKVFCSLNHVTKWWCYCYILGKENCNSLWTYTTSFLQFKIKTIKTFKWMTLSGINYSRPKFQIYTRLSWTMVVVHK